MLNIVTPSLCSKCFTFPCICGAQYKNLTDKQLKTLCNNLTKIQNNNKTTFTLKELITVTDMEKLPKAFISYLFEKHATDLVLDVWKELENSTMLWRSCLAIFLSKYSKNITTRKYYNLILRILAEFNVPINSIMAQVYLASDDNGIDIKTPMLMAGTSAILCQLDELLQQRVRKYVSACSHIATYSLTTTPASLMEALAVIILHIANLSNSNPIGSLNDNSIEMEDRIIYIDEAIYNFVYEELDCDFRSLKVS